MGVGLPPPLTSSCWSTRQTRRRGRRHRISTPLRELINVDRLTRLKCLCLFLSVHRFQELDLSTQCLMGQESNREEPWVNTVEATLQKEGKYKRVSVWGVECGGGGVCGGGGWSVWGWRVECVGGGGEGRVEGRVGCVGGGREGGGRECGVCGGWSGWREGGDGREGRVEGRVSVWGVKVRVDGRVRVEERGGEGWREEWDVWGVEGRKGESECVGVLGWCGSCVSLPAVVLCSSGRDTSSGVHQA